MVQKNRNGFIKQKCFIELKKSLLQFVIIWIILAMSSLSITSCQGYDGEHIDSDSEFEEINAGSSFYDKNYDSRSPDKVLAPEELHSFEKKRHARAVTSSKATTWPKAIVPYEMEDSYTGLYQRMMLQAMRHWENNTCVQFVRREAHHKNYVRFRQKNCACSSQIGHQGKGEQYSTISEECCGFSNVVHELGHIAGFYHEHQRPDRDSYIKILTENIRRGAEANFDKLSPRAIATMSTKYDFESIMHYHRKAFTIGAGLDTIVPRRGYTQHKLLRKNRLSEGDIEHAMSLYKCPKCGKSLLASSKNFESPKPKGLSSECEWRILASHGEKIALKISHLKMFSSPFCQKDYLLVFDGGSRQSKSLGRFCGNSVPNKVLISSGNRMLVVYRTLPGHSNYDGFKASYKTICGGSIHTDDGILESPHFPFYYKPNKDCVWHISVSKNYKVQLDFQFFQMQNSYGCKKDYLEITDPLSTKTLSRLCGDKKVGKITSNSHKMTVRFVSDSSKEHMKGFRAKIRKTKKR